MAVQYAGSDVELLNSLKNIDLEMAKQLQARATLPQRHQVENVLDCARLLREEMQEVVGENSLLEGQVSGLAAESEMLSTRIQSIKERLYGQPVPDARDADAMVKEIAMLDERLETTTNDQLVLMERLDPNRENKARVQARAEQLAHDLSAAQNQLQHAENEVDESLDKLDGERNAKIAELSQAVRSQYEAINTKLQFSAVANFVNGSCDGCHLALAKSEAAEIHKLSRSELITCEECGRILIEA